jgi:hippurate hydrolase
MGLTVRTYKQDVRKQVLAAITRITNAEAQAANAPKPPSIERYEMTDAVYNDPTLMERLKPALESAIGKGNLVAEEPIAASEDFSAFIAQNIPGAYVSLGGADPGKLAQAQADGTHLPSNHSAQFAPDVDPALHTAIATEVAMLRALLKAGVVNSER